MFQRQAFSPVFWAETPAEIVSQSYPSFIDFSVPEVAAAMAETRRVEKRILLDCL